MASAFDDEDLALSINPSHTRRGSARSPGDQHHQPPQPQPEIPQRRPQVSVTSVNAERRLGEYDIIKTLGEGSFGKVKLAVHHRSKQEVALKIISRRKLMARDMQGRIEREIQYLQLLRHPHIIKLYTVITTPAEIIMVLEYAGSELFNYIVDHGKMAEDKARQFFQQIVCAVEYCHRHKIVHRDLKPENLLLDKHLHVKIADFGLSNIMTDGNFLKTSCGSPNYAAPEVISGKLYAGPEVDVWSCGVILYVLLVGRLPFDDEYIPALFKKIAQGSYHVPHYLSPGAVRLIRKMLEVRPVNRITVQEIRQDPWFNKNLPEYLKPPVEEFLDTGVDPNKAIDPKSLTPSKPAAAVEKLHESVVGKLGKTMGYGREDVQQALAIDEPNAIKDAYLIVRENQIMRETPSLAQNPTLQPFLAQSPPTSAYSPVASMAEAAQPKSLSLSERPRQSSVSSGGVIADTRSPISTIAVLPSSVPDYHQAFMNGQPKASPMSPDVGRESGSPKEQTKEQQAATARRLKPHNRSQLQIEKMNRPEALTPLQTAQKKPKTTRWQFGIRSRNQPAEAMLAIYKALRAMGAEWEVPRARKPGRHGSEGGSPQDGGSGISSSSGSDDEGHDHSRDHDHSQDHYDSDNDEEDDDDHRLQRAPSHRDSIGSSTRGRPRSRYGAWNDWGYSVPQDPWIINARFRKEGMFPPGVVHSVSASSSRVDLRDPGTSSAGGLGSAKSSDTALSGRRRTSSGASTMATDNTNANAAHTGPSAAAQRALAMGTNTGKRELNAENPVADDSAYLYLTIQLYCIDKEFYQVDFKCAGYERLVRRLVREVARNSAGDGEDGTTEENSEEDGEEGRENADARSETPETPPEEHREGFEVGGKPMVRGQWDAIRRRRREVRKSSGDGEGEGDGQGEDEGEDEDDGSVTRSGIRLREELVGDGRAVEEKDVSSPFPFLDVASRLIIQLAEAD